jgi:putative ABC transport system ATP-binding protein
MGNHHRDGNGKARMASNGSLIDLRHVVKTYATPAGRFEALKGVDLRVDSGEFVSVVGKSGSGKTTLINMLTGIDRPTSGEIYVAGVPVHALDEGQLATWRGENVGIVFQFFQLLPTLTLLENVRLPMDFTNHYRYAERNNRAEELLESVGLGKQAGELPSRLSGGQQQRAAIARALANDPPILVADEPTGNLDSASAARVSALLERLVERHKTVVMVTHDRDLAARASRTIALADGEILGYSHS